MDAPLEFRNRLSRLFDDRLRIRWSQQRQEWHLEYRTARATLPKGYISSYDDRAVRAKDGYQFVLAVRPGDRMPCPKCNYTLKVPQFAIREVSCDYCTIKGTPSRHVACYFPLDGDSLIQHLSKFDPLKTWRDGLHKTIDLRNQLLEQARDRDFDNTLMSIGREHKNVMAGVATSSLPTYTNYLKELK